MLPSHFALAGGGHAPEMVAIDRISSVSIAERRIGQQRIACADRIDEPVDEAVEHEEAVERLVFGAAAGQHAAVAQLEDQQSCTRPASYSAEASGRTPESWSPSAKRASRSFGVIRSKPWNSRILPQRLATWLSATR